ncbi:hypothetical protein PGR6_00780 [Pseudomonas sp. GR 6-02]|nr:hypothetical protein PGR6_00780 [Pseudomonas sp. GR 6-02]
MWMSHHCGFPLSFLLSRRRNACGKGAAFSDHELESPSLAAYAVGCHQLTPFRTEYRQRLPPRNAMG